MLLRAAGSRVVARTSSHVARGHAAWTRATRRARQRTRAGEVDVVRLLAGLVLALVLALAACGKRDAQKPRGNARDVRPRRCRSTSRTASRRPASCSRRTRPQVAAQVGGPDDRDRASTRASPPRPGDVVLEIDPERRELELRERARARSPRPTPPAGRAGARLRRAGGRCTQQGVAARTRSSTGARPQLALGALARARPPQAQLGDGGARARATRAWRRPSPASSRAAR